MIRMLKTAKNSALKARTQAINQMKALIITAPAELRQTFEGLTKGTLITRCVGFRPGDLVTPMTAAKHALRSLARRYRHLTSEIEDLESELDQLTLMTAPALVEVFGVGADTAASLVVTAGDNPERLKSEAAFAALCGVSPIPASSGPRRTGIGSTVAVTDKPTRALHRVVLVRLRYDQRTKGLHATPYRAGDDQS